MKTDKSESKKAPASDKQQDDDTAMTCDVLRSLSSAATIGSATEKSSSRRSNKSCPKQHQLPMFLSKTYHMIDRCDTDVATWSPNGDNFVIKNVEKFAASVLPMYFKHSNFSSFARQLNFYGFRKLKAEPILTADFDAKTASYVRFYHEKFQKDKPELLSSIRRATKSDQQSKDDMDSLRSEVNRLKELIGTMSTDFERRMNEMTYEYNRRITALSAEHDKLAVLVQQLLGAGSAEALAAAQAKIPTDMMRSLSTVAALGLQNTLRQPAASLLVQNQAAAGLLAAVAAGQKRAAESLLNSAANNEQQEDGNDDKNGKKQRMN